MATLYQVSTDANKYPRRRAQGRSDPRGEHSEGGPWEALILVLINARFLCYATLSVTVTDSGTKESNIGYKVNE